MNIPIPARFSIEDLARPGRARVCRASLPADALDPASAPARGDHVLNSPAPEARCVAKARARRRCWRRSSRGRTARRCCSPSARRNMRSHSGQIAFPGGKIDEGETPLAAALREAREEIGLDPRAIEPLGWLDPYLTGTGFRIMPLVGDRRPVLHPDDQPATRSRTSSRRR